MIKKKLALINVKVALSKENLLTTATKFTDEAVSKFSWHFIQRKRERERN